MRRVWFSAENSFSHLLVNGFAISPGGLGGFLPPEPQVIENQKKPQHGDNQKQRKPNDQFSFQDGAGADIADPYLQGDTNDGC